MVSEVMQLLMKQSTQFLLLPSQSHNTVRRSWKQGAWTKEAEPQDPDDGVFPETPQCYLTYDTFPFYLAHLPLTN